MSPTRTSAHVRATNAPAAASNTSARRPLTSASWRWRRTSSAASLAIATPSTSPKGRNVVHGRTGEYGVSESAALSVKYTLATRRYCSKSALGRNDSGAYLVVLVRLPR